MAQFSQLQQAKHLPLARLMSLPKMQQAIQFVQLPLEELQALLEEIVIQNPLIDWDEKGGAQLESKDADPQELDFEKPDYHLLEELDSPEEIEKHHSFLIDSYSPPRTLHDMLREQTREAFTTASERAMAETLIGNMNEDGILEVSLKEIALLEGWEEEKLEKILKVIQTFEPVGVGARSLQESLLIQLRYQHKENSLAYRILEEAYPWLSKGDLRSIQHHFKVSLETIKASIKEDLMPLSFHIGSSLNVSIPPLRIPDASIEIENQQIMLTIEEPDSFLFRINSSYSQLLHSEKSSVEEKAFIRKHLSSIHWIQRSLLQRRETLRKVINAIIEKQHSFFLEEGGSLTPLTLHDIAKIVGLHEATVGRAVMHKWISTPKGVLPLRFFFSYGYTDQSGKEISSKSLQKCLKEIIARENHDHPFSDGELVKELEKKGYHCARRTVAKYRTHLKIGTAHQRQQLVSNSTN